MEGELEFAKVSLRPLYREYMPSVYRDVCVNCGHQVTISINMGGGSGGSGSGGAVPTPSPPIPVIVWDP